MVQARERSRIEKLDQVPRYLEAQGLLLDDLNVRLQKLLELTESMERRMERVPQGVHCTIEKTITGETITRVRLKEEPEADHRPFFSATITNDEDSANDLYVRINVIHKRFRRLRPSEVLKVDFHAPRLEAIYFKCAEATHSALAIIDGEY